VADCNQVNIFAGTLKTDRVTSSGTALRAYSGLAKIYRADSLVYYSGLNAQGEPGLRRARADSSGKYVINEELVEGVENMQLLYGLDSTTSIVPGSFPAGNVTAQQPASVIGVATTSAVAEQWRRVASVQVGLVVRSPMPASSVAPTRDEGQLSVLGVAYDQSAVTDGRYRTVYEVTIALRNRLFGN